MNINDTISIIFSVIFLIMGLYFNYKFNQIGKESDLSSAKSKR